jgi:serine/threonine protein kinase
MSALSIGKFHVLATLGTGAHSSILQVRRVKDSKQYALKVVPIGGPEDFKFLEQARHEFKVAQALHHPNLIKIYSLEMVRDWLFRIRKVHLLIEYVNGKTLDTVPRLGMPRLVQVFEKVAAGLVHMHRRSIYHADLKPNNILLSRSGDVKVIDFGLARMKDAETTRIQGTPEYIAPEQARDGVVNERTDIYNLGATMYRMVTWRHPPSPLAGGEGGIALDAKTWQKMLTPVQEYSAEAPKALCDLIHRCLSFKPDKRPERSSEVQGTLDHLVEELVKAPEDRLEMLEF